jgi:hypothetical protein
MSRELMIKELSKTVIPAIRELGFKGSFPHFRRIRTDRINLLTFQFDRYGGGFVIEIVNCASAPDSIMNSIGQEIKINKLTAHDFTNRKRIQSNMKTESSLTEDWFRYDKKYLFGFGNIYKHVCKDVLSKLPIACEYWDNGEINN